MKLVEKLKEIGKTTLIVALAGTLGYITSYQYCDGIRSVNALGRTIKDAKRIEHVIQEGEELGDGLRSLRKIYFPLGIVEFKAINNLNSNYNYRDTVATNMWVNRVLDENDIPVSILGTFVNRPYKIKTGDIIKVPKR